MKIAELPDGFELYFPEEYDDQKMDEAVMRYLQAQTKHDEMQLEEMRMLRKTIEKGVTQIATIMAAPKELVRDWKDKPIGVKPKL